MRSVSVSLAAERVELAHRGTQPRGRFKLRESGQPFRHHRRDGWRRYDRIERNVARGQQRAVGEDDDQNRLDVTPAAEAPEDHPSAEQQHRFEKHGDGMVEANGEKFLDVLRCIRIAQILEQVYVQMVAVRVEQARREACERAKEIALGGQARVAPRGGVRDVI